MTSTIHVMTTCLVHINKIIISNKIRISTVHDKHNSGGKAGGCMTITTWANQMVGAGVSCVKVI